MKLKYLLILLCVSFFTVLICLHVFNNFGEEEVLLYHSQDNPLVNPPEESEHVPDYIIEEEEDLEAGDTFEELDGNICLFFFVFFL